MSFEEVTAACARPWVGGSSISPINKIPNPGNRTPLTEFRRLRGQAPELDAEDEEFFAGRRALEPFVNHKLTAIAKVTAHTFNERYTHPKYPWLRAEIDAEDDDGNYEFKTSSEHVARLQFGEEGSEDFPAHILAQVQLGLLIRPKPIAFVCVCIGFDRFKRFPVEPDRELQDMLVDGAHDFLQKYVIPGIPPPPVNFADAALLWPKSLAKSILASEEVFQELQFMADLDEQIKELSARKDASKLEVQKAFGENDTLILPDGRIAATWKNNKDSQVVDKDALIDEYETELRKQLLGGMAWVEARRLAHTRLEAGVRVLLNKMKKR